ncbi:MAG: DUF262 domain-containing protein [Peptostreptococcaceae bacterium]
MIRYEDIPMLTRYGNNEFNIHLGHLESTLKSYEEDYGLELSPDFQRGHVWTEEQQIAYVEFFLRGGKTGKIIYFNCPSFCGVYRDNDPIVCVDGLQRLTALRKFLDNKLPVFGGNYIDDFEDKKTMLRRLDGLKFSINDLKTKKEVLTWYLEFNTGGTVHSDEEIERVRKLLDNCN